MTTPNTRQLDAAHSSTGLLPALLCAVLSYSLMQTLLVPALPEIVASLGLDAAGGGWVLTAYLLSGAIAAPILGALGDAYGHRRLLLWSMGAFVVGSALCVIGGAFPLFLAGRVLQGASTASFPLALAIVRRHLPSDRQAAAVGWLSGTLGLGAGAALVIGGFIAEVLTWEWLFVVGVVLGALSMVLVACWVPRSPRSGSAPTRLDWVGASLLALTLSALLLAVSQGSSWGWASPVVLGLAALAVLAAVLLWVVEQRVQHPLVDVRVLSKPALISVNLLTLLLGFIPYLFYVGLPAIFQALQPHGFGMDVAQTGFAMLPGAILVFLGGRMTPKLLTKLRPGVVGMIALAAMGVGSVGAAVCASSLLALIGFFSLVGLGNGLGFALAADLVSRLVPRDEIAAAVGVNGVLRTVGSAFGTPITMLILASGVTHGTSLLLFTVATVAAMVGVVTAATIRAPK